MRGDAQREAEQRDDVWHAGIAHSGFPPGAMGVIATRAKWPRVGNTTKLPTMQAFVSKRSLRKDCYPGLLDVTISGVVNYVSCAHALLGWER